MRFEKWLRMLVLPLVFSSLTLLASGCGGGGGGGGKEAGVTLPPAEDPSLDPTKDSTMVSSTPSNDPAIAK